MDYNYALNSTYIIQPTFANKSEQVVVTWLCSQYPVRNPWQLDQQKKISSDSSFANTVIKKSM